MQILAGDKVSFSKDGAIWFDVVAIQGNDMQVKRISPRGVSVPADARKVMRVKTIAPNEYELVTGYDSNDSTVIFVLLMNGLFKAVSVAPTLGM